MSKPVEPPYPPCSICGHETGLSAKESCEHTCQDCEGTRYELDNHPCMVCNGTGLRSRYQPLTPQQVAATIQL